MVVGIVVLTFMQKVRWGLVAIDKNEHVLSDFPFSSKQRETHNDTCNRVTSIIPGEMLHMAQPNQTSKDRYSIAFNTEVNRMSGYHRRQSRLESF